MNDKVTKKTTKKRATRKTKTLSNEPVTIAELQSWLSGVIEFQEANWTPNKEQWSAVLNKIQNLVNDNNTQPSSNNSTIPENNQQPMYNQPVVNPSVHRQSFITPPNGPPVQERIAPPNAPLPAGKTVIHSNKPAPKASEVLPRIDKNGQPQSSFK